MKLAKGSAVEKPPLEKRPPPEYNYNDDETDLTAGFAKLNLSRGSSTTLPSADECIAHLKLLEAFSRLRESIGCQDGLYGLSNNLIAESAEPALKSQLLAQMREKRWAMFVTIATMRFESWWNKISENRMLPGYEQESAAFRHYPEVAKPLKFTAESLPPLGAYRCSRAPSESRANLVEML